MENKQPLAVLFAMSKEDGCESDPILIDIGNKEDVEKKRIELETVNADFQLAISEVYVRNPHKSASTLGMNDVIEYQRYYKEVSDKIRKEINDLLKDAPPYYNHNLIMLSQ